MAVLSSVMPCASRASRKIWPTEASPLPLIRNVPSATAASRSNRGSVCAAARHRRLPAPDHPACVPAARPATGFRRTEAPARHAAPAGAALPPAPLAEIQSGQLEDGVGAIGLQFERLAQIGLGQRDIALLFGAQTGIGHGQFGLRIQRVANGSAELCQAFIVAAAGTEKPAVVVVRVRIVAIEINGAAKIYLGQLVLGQIHVDHAVDVVGRAIAIVSRDRLTQLVERDLVLGARGVGPGQLRECTGTFAALAVSLAGCHTAAPVHRLCCATRQQCRCNQYPYPFLHAASLCIRFMTRPLLSATFPASCPQAASISSPRVLRVGTTKPASCRIWRNTRIDSARGFS